jgi:hypothetical protein
MGVECPKCHFDNPFDSKYYEENITQAIPSEAISTQKATLKTPPDEITAGLIFTGKYKIIEELGKDYI